MKKYLVLLIVGVTGWAGVATAQFTDFFVAEDMNTSYNANDCLITNGSGVLSWSSTCGSGGGGGGIFSTTTDGLAYTNSWTTVLIGGTASTTNAQLEIIGETASDYFTASSTTSTSTFPNISATQLLISGDYITDFAGTNLTVTSGVLNVDNPVVANLTGDVTGNADTATALAANAANCGAGLAPRGVDQNGAVENCFDVWTEAENTAAAYISNITGSPLDELSNVAALTETTGDILYYTASNNWNVLNAGSDGQVLKLASGIPSWGTDNTGSGGSGFWATTTGDTQVSLATPSNQVAIGTTTFTQSAALTISATSTDTTKLISFLNDTSDEVLYITDEGLLSVGSDTSGDSEAIFGLDGYEWDIGFDDTDNSFAIASGTTLGTNNALTIDKNLRVTMGNASTSLLTVASNFYAPSGFAGDALTISNDAINFDGGASPGGELGGTWASPTIDDSLAVSSWNLTTPTFTTNFTFDGTTVTGLSGADVTVITGTAGTSGNCVQWNADGDIVDAGAACGTGSGGGTLSTTTEKIGAGDAATVSYLTDEFMLGGSSSTTAEFLFDYASSTLEIKSADALSTTTLMSTDATESVRLGEGDQTTDLGWIIGEAIEFDFGTAGDVIVRGLSSVTEWVTDLAMTISGTLTATGIVDFGGATSFEVPNGASPTVDATGETAVDTTSDQFIYYGASNKRVLTPFDEKSVYIASSTLDKDYVSFSSGTSTFEMANYSRAVTLDTFYCKTDTGTTFVRFGDGTNWTAEVQCTSSGATGSSLSNNTFTAREDVQVQVGTAATNPNKTTITASFLTTAD